MEDASGFPRLTSRMLERGFGPDDVRGILGENLLRVYEKVWTSGALSSEEGAA